jgi:CO/xanthine dehydrogenase FAD-binding subunit
MKAAPFDYVRAEGLAHALDLLAEHGADAKLIAGGQSLVPMMSMRLARPTLLVDIYRLPELRDVTTHAASVTIGAAVRQKDIQNNANVLRQLPLVANALPWVGHQQTRNRGTVGGSLVHADPSAELPLAFLVLGGTAEVQSRDHGTRRIAAEDFFQGPMFTAVAEDECLVHTEWPVCSDPRSATAFEETSIRHGDFAMASAGCQLSLDTQGRVSALRCGVGGVGSTPLVFPELASQLVGQAPTAANLEALAHNISEQLDPHNDVHVQAPFRRHLARVLLQRVLTQAAERAAQA